VARGQRVKTESIERRVEMTAVVRAAHWITANVVGWPLTMAKTARGGDQMGYPTRPHRPVQRMVHKTRYRRVNVHDACSVEE